jgi:hypothetical protein
VASAPVPGPAGPGFWPVDLGPGVIAGFTTRHGGVSPAPWDSLDLGLGTGDEPGLVRRNRVLVERLVGVPLSFATQVHGTGCVDVGPNGREGERERVPTAEAQPDTVGEADVLVAGPGRGVAILVADCVPVLLADPVTRRVAAVHAGRRGVALDVVGVAMGVLRAAGARPGDVRAVVGPSVCGRCYEVPADMRDEVASAVPEAWSTTRAGTSALDLRAGVAAQLARAGVSDVERLDVCTMEDPRLFSHRRDHGATGRFAGVVARVATGDTPGRLPAPGHVAGLA